ncbi:hypothetical protein Tco_1289723 [Tanacetum coccineum]
MAVSWWGWQLFSGGDDVMMGWCGRDYRGCFGGHQLVERWRLEEICPVNTPYVMLRPLMVAERSWRLISSGDGSGWVVRALGAEGGGWRRCAGCGGGKVGGEGDGGV